MLASCQENLPTRGLAVVSECGVSSQCLNPVAYAEKPEKSKAPAPLPAAISPEENDTAECSQKPLDAEQPALGVAECSQKPWTLKNHLLRLLAFLLMSEGTTPVSSAKPMPPCLACIYILQYYVMLTYRFFLWHN
uniref:Uncharacterized protein n=1 Tax=Chenopodium quinoa TaxID=63459 RepID=A0A803NAH5_CHEQI